MSAIERLSAAVESGDGTLSSLTSRLADRERDLAIVRSRRREVEEQAGRKEKLPSAAKLLQHLEAVKVQLLVADSDGWRGRPSTGSRPATAGAAESAAGRRDAVGGILRYGVRKTPCPFIR